MKTISKYQCQKCNAVYAEMKFALTCESRPVNKCPFEIGKKYYNKSYRRAGTLKKILWTLPVFSVEAGDKCRAGHGWQLVFDSQIKDLDHIPEEVLIYQGIGSYDYNDYDGNGDINHDEWEEVKE